MNAILIIKNDNSNEYHNVKVKIIIFKSFQNFSFFLSATKYFGFILLVSIR